MMPAGKLPALAALGALLLCPRLAPPLASQSAPIPPESFTVLTWLTEESPPDNFTRDGKLTGFFVDTLALVWKDLGVPPQAIQVLPWARAYQRLLDSPGTVLFSMGRTAERESLFKWAGPLRSTRFVLLAKKSRAIKLPGASPADLAPYAVGTVHLDAAEQLLASGGKPLKDLDRSESLRSLILKLANDRVDLAAYGELPARAYLSANGMDPEAYETVYLLSETPLFFGFHLSTPDALVERFQAAVDRVKATPAFAALERTYDARPPGGR